MVPAAMAKTLRYLFLSTLLWASLSCRPMTPVSSPAPLPLPSEEVVQEVVPVPEPAQVEALQPCNTLCAHLQGLAGDRPFSVEECEQLCRSRSTPARTRCLLSVHQFDNLKRCDY